MNGDKNMQTIELEILDFQDNWYFRPIRDSLDYIQILLRTCENLLVSRLVPQISSNKIGEIKIIFNKKFSRVFFFKEDKFFSLFFPFKLISENEGDSENGDMYNIYLDKILIDNKLLNEINTILNHSIYTEEKSILDFYAHYTPDIIEDGISIDAMICLEKLIHIEPSYIRYDYDEANADEEHHPLNHFDFNYTEKSKIKVGIKKKIDFDFFKDFLDNQMKCSYLDS